MPKMNDFDAMSDLCIAAAEAVMRVGSDDLKAAARVLLCVLGKEIAVRLESDVPAARSVSARLDPLQRLN